MKQNKKTKPERENHRVELCVGNCDNDK